MRPGMASRRLPALQRMVTHPAVWPVPAMALLVLVAMPFNDAFYGFFVNYDAQGEAQQHELLHTTRIFRYTSGVLCGQVLALLAGAALAGRNAQARALAVAAPLSVLRAGVAGRGAYPPASASARCSGGACGDPRRAGRSCSCSCSAGSSPP